MTMTTAFDRALNEGRIREYALVITNGSGIQRAVILSGSLTGAWTWSKGFAAAVSADTGESWSVMSVDEVAAEQAIEQAERNLAEAGQALMDIREAAL